MESKKFNLSKAINDNGKTVELYIELCLEWGFSSTKNQVVSQLIKALNLKGYNVNYAFEPVEGGNGEYFVFAIKNGVQQIVFSNDEDVHGSKGAVIGFDITSENVDMIIKKIVE